MTRTGRGVTTSGLGRRSSCPDEARLTQVCGVGEPDRAVCDDANAGAPVTARCQILDPTVVEVHRVAFGILGKHLGEFRAIGKGCGEDTIEHWFIDHATNDSRTQKSALDHVQWRGTVGRMTTAPPPDRPRNAPDPSELAAGATALVTHIVTEADTAIAIGSGSVAVLATPRLLALCEQASVEAVQDSLADGTTTVGVRVMMDHVMPGAVGSQVRAEATLEKVKGRKLFFTTAAYDERGLIAAGKVVRVLVDTGTFLAKCD